jgi:peroxin-13
MVSVAEQFGNLRHTLGSILGIYTLTRWLRNAMAKLTGRPPPASAKDLTPAKFAKFAGTSGTLPNGQPAPSPSRKPLAFFLLAVFGLPYLMGKLIRALARNQEEKMALQAAQGPNPMDPNQLEFCRVLYDFTPENTNGAAAGVDLAVKAGEMVAVLAKSDPLGNPSEWWKCRTRDGRSGYLPSPYLETIVRRLNAQNALPAPPQQSLTNLAAGTTPAGSRAQTMSTNQGGSRASTLTGMGVADLVKAQQEREKMKVPVLAGGPGAISVESFQKAGATGSGSGGIGN